MTHTVAELAVSPATYFEISAALKAAGYHHAFLEDGLVDMSGIGLVLALPQAQPPAFFHTWRMSSGTTHSVASCASNPQASRPGYMAPEEYQSSRPLYFSPDLLPGVPADTVPAAWRDALVERRRQIQQEGWNESHDDGHQVGDLADAGAAYAIEASYQDATGSTSASNPKPPGCWPWGTNAWKPKDIRRNLVRATALLLAAIERFDRAKAAKA